MIFRIPVHSIVDVITNSSSVIYTEAKDNSIALAKDIIDSVLKAAGSDKTADDVFNFSVTVYPDDLFEYLSDKIDYVEDEDDDDAKEFVDRIPNLSVLKKALDYDNFRKKNGDPDYDKREAALKAWENDNKEAIAALFKGVESNVQEGMPATLVVTTKDGVDIEFAKNAVAMFDISESSN